MKLRVPHTLVLLFGMCVVAWAMSHALEQGAFERETRRVHGHEREWVVPGSYAPLAKRVELPWHFIFAAVPRGLMDAADIIFFVFVIGGAFGVLRATGATDAGIGALLRRLGHRPELLLGGGILLFAAGSSTIGMAEEYIPFVAVMVALCVGLRFDAVTAVAVIYVGCGIGYGAAAANPFTIVPAQTIAGIEPLSGMAYRLALFPIFFAVGFHHTWRYARRVREDASRSLVADLANEKGDATHDAGSFTRTHAVVLAVTGATIGFLVYAIDAWGWYLEELTALFFGLAVVLGVLARMGPSRIAERFCDGAAELTTTALLVGVARGIQVTLQEGKVIDTIIASVAEPLAGADASVAAVGMFFVQSLCNLFVPSGSGQAYVTMPIMAPLGDLVGVSRQTSVLAYQFGDGFTNMVVPTNAVLVGMLAIARVPFDRWLRFILPLMVKIWIVGSIALVVAVAIGYGASAQPPHGLEQLESAPPERDFDAFLARSTSESEAFRRSLLEPTASGDTRARSLARAILAFRERAPALLDGSRGLDAFALEEDDLVRRMSGRAGPIDGAAVYGPFEGRWYGRWDGQEVDHHWGPYVEIVSPPREYELPDGGKVRLVGYQYAWVGDGYALNHVVSASDDAGRDATALLGYVVHVEDGDIAREVVRRPHVGIALGGGRIIWVTAREVFLEEAFGPEEEEPDAYAITGFNYDVTEAGAVRPTRGFQAIYSRDAEARVPWRGFDL